MHPGVQAGSRRQPGKAGVRARWLEVHLHLTVPRLRSPVCRLPRPRCFPHPPTCPEALGRERADWGQEQVIWLWIGQRDKACLIATRRRGGDLTAIQAATPVFPRSFMILLSWGRESFLICLIFVIRWIQKYYKMWALTYTFILFWTYLRSARGMPF